jgi:hypothetical protein
MPDLLHSLASATAPADRRLLRHFFFLFFFCFFTTPQVSLPPAKDKEHVFPGSS